MSDRRSGEWPIWAPGMEAIYRALEPEALAMFKATEIGFWSAERFKRRPDPDKEPPQEPA